jgi:hypothetical protein
MVTFPFSRHIPGLSLEVLNDADIAAHGAVFFAFPNSYQAIVDAFNDKALAYAAE